jgi:single-stranded DNA-binding protein
MSFHVLVTGTLTADPTERTGQTGKMFATGNIRCVTEDGSVHFSIIGFGDVASELLKYRQGSTFAVSGRAKCTSWIGQDGSEKRGISITMAQIISASAAQRADADRRKSARRTVGDVGAGDGRPLPGRLR